MSRFPSSHRAAGLCCRSSIRPFLHTLPIISICSLSEVVKREARNDSESCGPAARHGLQDGRRPVWFVLLAILISKPVEVTLDKNNL